MRCFTNNTTNFFSSVGNIITTTREQYKTVIKYFLLPEIDELGLENMWFQQDGATSHTASLVFPIYADPKNRFPTHDSFFRTFWSHESIWTSYRISWFQRRKIEKNWKM